jgi:hypothetical protein
MERTVKVTLTFLILLALIMTVFVCQDTRENVKILGEYRDELPLVKKELKRRSADDCSLERMPFGWKCVNLTNKKIYNINI